MEHGIGPADLEVMQENDICDLCDYIATLEQENEILDEENVKFYDRKESLHMALGFYGNRGGLQIPNDVYTPSAVIEAAEKFYNYLTQTED